jgi:hypothetical protein
MDVASSEKDCRSGKTNEPADAPPALPRFSCFALGCAELLLLGLLVAVVRSAFLGELNLWGLCSVVVVVVALDSLARGQDSRLQGLLDVVLSRRLSAGS